MSSQIEVTVRKFPYWYLGTYLVLRYRYCSDYIGMMNARILTILKLWHFST